MSGQEIKDGSGSQRLAFVDEENRLLTRAVSQPNIGHHSLHDGKAFSAYMRHTFAAADTDEDIAFFYLPTTTTNKVVISQLTVVTTGTASKLEVFFQPTGRTGGDLVTMLGLNLTSSVISSAIAYHKNPTAFSFTHVAANEFIDIRVGTGQPSFTFSLNDALILGPGDALGFVGESSGIGDKMRINCYYYEINAFGNLGE